MEAEDMNELQKSSNLDLVKSIKEKILKPDLAKTEEYQMIDELCRRFDLALKHLAKPQRYTKNQYGNLTAEEEYDRKRLTKGKA